MFILHPAIFFLGQGAVATVSYADAAVITPIVIKGYLVFVGCLDSPAYPDGSLSRTEGFYEPQGTAQFADEATFTF
jgi:hypothetical protein